MLKYKKKEIEAAINDSYGIKGTVISRLGCSYPTLARYLKKFPDLDDQLRSERSMTDDLVESKMIEQIKNGNTSMIIFYLKTRMGYRETNRIDHTSSDGSIAQKKACTEEETIEKLKKAFERAKEPVLN